MEREEITFPVIRKKFPISLKNKLEKVYPKESKYYPPVKEMVIIGGLIHSSIEGYIFTPYELQILTLQYPVDKNNKNFHLVMIIDSKVIEIATSEEEYKEVEWFWKKKVEEYNNER